MFKSKSTRAAERAAKQLQLEQPVVKQNYFQNCHRTYSCIHCRAHLANHDELISKLFQGNHGRAYLFNKVMNIGCKQAVERELLTGLHAVADIYCDSCETTLGWKYEQAFVASQKYKEGKYIIELVHMLKENDWDLTSYNARELLEDETSGGNCLRSRGAMWASLDDNFGVGTSNSTGSSRFAQETRRRKSEGEPANKREKRSNVLIKKNNDNSEQSVLDSRIQQQPPSSSSSPGNQINHATSDSINQSSVGVIRDDVVLLAQQRSKQMPLPDQYSYGDSNDTNENNHTLNMTTTTTETTAYGIELLERSLSRLQVESQSNRQLSTPMISQSLSPSPKSSSTCSSSRSPSDVSSSSSSSSRATDGNST